MTVATPTGRRRPHRSDARFICGPRRSRGPTPRAGSGHPITRLRPGRHRRPQRRRRGRRPRCRGLATQSPADAVGHRRRSLAGVDRTYGWGRRPASRGLTDPGSPGTKFREATSELPDAGAAGPCVPSSRGRGRHLVRRGARSASSWTCSSTAADPRSSRHAVGGRGAVRGLARLRRGADAAARTPSTEPGARREERPMILVTAASPNAERAVVGARMAHTGWFS
jgi:hypothetical protein